MPLLLLYQYLFEILEVEFKYLAKIQEIESKYLAKILEVKSKVPCQDCRIKIWTTLLDDASRIHTFVQIS